MFNRNKLDEMAQPRSQEEVKAAEQRKEKHSQFDETREALSEAYTQEQLNYVGNDDHPKDVRWEATAFTAQDIQEAYKEGFRAGHSYARMVYHIS
jgi:flagellar biosynthesis/type III secretory pathway protein FliH